MSKTGRKSVYNTNIKSYFQDISVWTRNGVAERSMAKALGILYSTFNKYK